MSAARRLLLLLLCAAVARAAEIPSELLHGTTTKNRYNIVFMGDGWTKAQLDQGEYKRLCAEFKDHLLSRDPFKANAKLLAITRVDVPSNDAGVGLEGDPKTGGKLVDNYFGTQRRLVDPKDPKKGYLQNPWFKNEGDYIKTRIAEVNPGQRKDTVVILVNDDRPGGRAEFSSAYTFGYCTVTARHTDSAPVVAHEVGHAAFVVHDEYDSGHPNDPTEPPREEPTWPNVTLQSNPKLVKWRKWIEANSPGIGVFEGGLHLRRGVWRPKRLCAMNGTEREPFCAVCQEAAYQQIFARTRVVETVEPDHRDTHGGYHTNVYPEDPGMVVPFKVTTLERPGFDLTGTWSVDFYENKLPARKGVAGTRQDGPTGPTFSYALGFDTLAPGIHDVTLRLIEKPRSDANEFVKLLTPRHDEIKWSIQIVARKFPPEILKPSSD